MRQMRCKYNSFGVMSSRVVQTLLVAALAQPQAHHGYTFQQCCDATSDENREKAWQSLGRVIECPAEASAGCACALLVPRPNDWPRPAANEPGRVVNAAIAPRLVRSCIIHLDSIGKAAGWCHL